MPAIDPASGERLLELANQLEEIVSALRGQAYALQRDPDAKTCGVREFDALLRKHYSAERLEALTNETRPELSMVKP